MKFATAAALVAACAQAEPNVQFEDGFRMKATTVRSDKGGLIDVIHDQSFKLDTGN